MLLKKSLPIALGFAFIAGIASAQPRGSSAAPRPPEISKEVETLPPNVRRMRALILEAVRSGDSQQLKKPIEINEVPPSFTRNAPHSGNASPASKGPAMAAALIQLFRERSGDGAGRETMGQLINILAVGHARTNIGSAQEMYVWPYFSVLDPRLLTPEQEVDAHRVMSAYTLREWREKGRYPGWRIGIGPDGTWHYFHGAD
jgi:hypothetical protein